MPQRNGQNPIKSGNRFGQGSGSPNATGNFHEKKGNAGGHCPACGAEVPAKPGFRLSALKCPKCGAAMSKK